MNRRAFLGTLAAGAVGLALDPERLLWVPGAKKIFIPAPPTLATSIALQAGDVFTIAGVYAVNPMTGRTTEYLQSFVITEKANPGPVALTAIVPRPMHDGPYRNVNHFGGVNQIQPLKCGLAIPCAVTWVDG